MQEQSLEIVTFRELLKDIIILGGVIDTAAFELLNMKWITGLINSRI